MDTAEKLIFGLLVLLILAMAIAIRLSAAHEDDVRAAFMAECEKDRKHYECVAMWRAGNGSDSTVIPVPIVVPVR